MSLWKTPPKAKIYEALGALGDGRVTITSTTTAEVISSSRDKKYIVQWSEDEKGITANDNASYWQGYMGYPIIAVLMLRGKLRYDKSVAYLLSEVQWKSLNARFRNNYDKAIETVLNSIEESKGQKTKVVEEVDRIMRDISSIKLKRLPIRKQPPK
jgi:hypothetical protein